MIMGVQKLYTSRRLTEINVEIQLRKIQDQHCTPA